MHSRGELSNMQRGIDFKDVVGEVRSELDDALARARSTGIDEEQVVLDPGIGFGKTREQNLALIARSTSWPFSAGRPPGASRKSSSGGAGQGSREPAAVAWTIRTGDRAGLTSPRRFSSRVLEALGHDVERFLGLLTWRDALDSSSWRW